MRLLAISRHAPPQLRPEAIQVARLLYHLDAGVTLLHGRDAHDDPGFDQYPDFFERVAALGVGDPGRPRQRPWQRVAVRALSACGARPDLHGRWRRAACHAALAHIAKHRTDVLASFGSPMSSHLVGLALKRHTGLPWLAHFSEPWADNPCHHSTFLQRRINLGLERRVVAHADQLLFTSARMLELVMGKYSPAWRYRAAVLPQAWDMMNFATSLATPAPPSVGARRVIRHISACHGDGSPEHLVAALARIHAGAPRRLDGVVFELVGPVAPALLASRAFKALPPGLLMRHGQVGYRAALALARDASALLVTGGPGAGASMSVPGKVIDYIGARRPIWAITPPGPCASLVAAWTGGGHTCADPDEPATVAGMLMAGVDGLDCQPTLYGPDQIVLSHAPVRVAQSLKQYLRHALGRCARAGLLARAQRR